MTAPFVDKEFQPGDAEGFGMWRSQHSYEHQKFIELARNFTNPVVLREYDILSWDDDPVFRNIWLAGHYDMHLSLRDITGIQGVDLTKVDWDEPQDVLVWLENHKFEHEILEQAFGLT